MTTLCTYFDRAFLPRGLALHESLVRHWNAFRLLVLCLDDDTARVLRRLRLQGVDLLTLADLEDIDPDLQAARDGRSRVGYYMTCTPSLLRHALQRGTAGMYLDADLYFFSSPRPILDEWASAAIYIHEHRPDQPAWDASFGRFNVGLVAIRNDTEGLACVNRWREQCLEWCEHERVDGRFGDQRYLDDWPDRFRRVVVAAHPGVGVAPWNIADHSFALGPGGGVMVDGQPLVFFHFTRMLEIAPAVVRTYAATYAGRLDPTLRRHVYAPYLRSLQHHVERVRREGVVLDSAVGRTTGAREGMDYAAGAPRRSSWTRAGSLVGGLRSGELMLSWRGFAL